MNINEIEVSGPQLADLLGLSDRRVRQLAADGVVTKLDRGAYLLAASVRAIIAKYEAEAGRRVGAAAELAEEKLKTIRMKNALADRKAIDLDEALGIFDELTGLYVSSLNGLPARITSIPRERRRLDDIFDEERLRLCDQIAKKLTKLEAGQESDTVPNP